MCNSYSSASALIPTVRVPQRAGGRMPRFRYAVYGLSVKSNVALKYPRQSTSQSCVDVAIEIVPDTLRHVLKGAAIHHLNGSENSLLPDGSVYLRWPNLAEFLGKRLQRAQQHGTLGR